MLPRDGRRVAARSDLPAVRRTQFSSCDACRSSRVRCDALSRTNLTGESSASCTRCLNRSKQCTFKWMQDVKDSGAAKRTLTPKRRSRRHSPAPSSTPSNPRHSEAVASQQNTPSQAPLTSSEPADWSYPDVDWSSRLGLTTFQTEVDLRNLFQDSIIAPSPAATASTISISELLGPSDAQWLQSIYGEVFSAIFGSWMGRHGCPFVLGENSPAEESVSIAGVCGQLDRWMTDASSDAATPGTSGSRFHVKKIKDTLIDQSLRSTIAAFSARWLPVTSSKTRPDEWYRDLAQALWRDARRDMLRVVNRPSYRSMLTLFLFALTPIPYGVSEDDEVDGISGQICVHAALQQIQTLRARQRNLQFSGSKVSPSTKPSEMEVSPESIGTSDFIMAESTAYWAALTFDTSASLTLNCRSLLSSGLFGFEAELPWRLVRTGAKIFHEAVQCWRGDGIIDMTDERANQVIASGSAWKLLAWKLTAVFKEALRDGHDESQVSKAYAAVRASMQEFNATYRGPLHACQNRMQFLNQQIKLRWYSLMLHYHLSILMLVDIIEATDRGDLLTELAQANAEAENAVMNTLVFGLHNHFTLRTSPRSSADDASGSVSEAGATTTVPIVSIDPYPHHVVASVQLLRKAIDRDAGLGKVSELSNANLQATLEQILNHLPQSSKSVQAARNGSPPRESNDMVRPRQDPYIVLHAQYAE